MWGASLLKYFVIYLCSVSHNILKFRFSIHKADMSDRKPFPGSQNL